MSAALFAMRLARIAGSAPAVIYAHDIVAGRLDELPGWRYYHYLSAGGYPMGHSSTVGALVLYDVERERARLRACDDSPATAAALDALLDIDTERRRVLHSGPSSAHSLRARHIAIAFLDGAYVAVHQLDPVFYLRSGERSRSTYDTLRRAHDTAQPSYERLRDYLADDAGVPYLIACYVSARMTDSDRRSPFNGLTLRPLPF